MQWLADAMRAIEGDEEVVLVTLASATGSAPRRAGAKMLVLAEGSSGSVGGGAMERRAVKRARDLLAGGERRRLEPSRSETDADSDSAAALLFERLGRDDLAALAACRARLAEGGAVMLTPLDDQAAAKQVFPAASAPADLAETVAGGTDAAVLESRAHGRCLVERVEDRRTRLWLFGAGHVGRALARALAPLPFHLTWVEDRPDLLPPTSTEDVVPLASSAPANEVARIPAGAFVLAMTHSHGLDFAIVEAALRRGDLGFVGLIGSARKKAQFLGRCRANGLTEEETGRLVCPIGVAGVGGREPAVIAASVAVQLLQTAEARTAMPADLPAPG